MRVFLTAFLCGVTALLSHSSAAAIGTFQGGAKGRVHVTALSGDPMGIHTDVHLFRPGWKLVSLDAATDVDRRKDDGIVAWTGKIPVADGQMCSFSESLRVTDTTAEIELRIKAESNMALEGIFFWVQMPVDLFAGGWGTLKTEGGWPTGISLPAQEPYHTHVLGTSDATLVNIQGPQGTPELTMRLARPHKVQIQDDRQWNRPNYGALVEMHEGSLAAGQTVSLNISLTLLGRIDRAPATLTLNADSGSQSFNGMGGNYCFGIDSPQVDYTLDNLQVTFARTQMSLDLWEPHNDDDNPSRISWGQFLANDRPGTKLRREFELAQRLQEKGIPLCVSLWYLPHWMYENPELDRNTIGRRVERDGWDELIESMGSYLLYLRRRYRVEPALVSVNEPDLGVHVKLTADEYAEFLLLLNAFLNEQQLKTKILLGDVSNPRHAFDYVESVTESKAALTNAGAVGFHTWGGALPDDYRAWRELADRLNLPLLVTEVGLDAKAWQTRSYETWSYALQELKMMQNLLRYDQPQSALYWQLTSDYALLSFDDSGPGEPRPELSKRFWFFKHFSDLTMPNAKALTTESSHDNVQFTAYAAQTDGIEHYVLHVSNPGAARHVTVTGLPDAVKALHPVVTDGQNSYFQKPALIVRDNSLELDVTAHSLTTLTSQPPDKRDAKKSEQ